MAKYDVAAYVWPSYTGDEPRSRIFWPEGIGEWETVKAAKPCYPGHPWPRKPLWGYCNEADPAVMEKQIAEAKKYGVNVFIYDWYWYDRRPFLETCLDNGFLKAKNRGDMRFYLMWANHDANYLWDKRLAGSPDHGTVVWTGRVKRADFEEMAARLFDKYFFLDNYYKIDGKPVFMIFDLANFVFGIGGADAAAEAVAWLRNEAKKRGLPGLYLQTVVRDPSMIYDGLGIDPAERGTFYVDTVRRVGFDGVTNYNYGNLTPARGDYGEILKKIPERYEQMAADYPVPYFPCVGLGWDNNSRHPHAFRPAIITGNTPERVEEAFRIAKAYLDTHSLPAPLVTVNSWNEWTEDSYLQPDDRRGYAFLEELRRVFG